MGAFWARGREIGAETHLPSPHGCRLQPLPSEVDLGPGLDPVRCGQALRRLCGEARVDMDCWRRFRQRLGPLGVGLDLVIAGQADAERLSGSRWHVFGDVARLLLAIVQRHLRSLRFGFDPAYPEEDWGFTAQQAVGKLLKDWIVLADLAQQAIPPLFLELQVFAVEARYGEGPFALPISREELLGLLEGELQRCLEGVEAAG